MEGVIIPTANERGKGMDKKDNITRGRGDRGS